MTLDRQVLDSGFFKPVTTALFEKHLEILWNLLWEELKIYRGVQRFGGYILSSFAFYWASIIHQLLLEILLLLVVSIPVKS